MGATSGALQTTSMNSGLGVGSGGVDGRDDVSVGDGDGDSAGEKNGERGRRGTRRDSRSKRMDICGEAWYGRGLYKGLQGDCHIRKYWAVATRPLAVPGDHIYHCAVWVRDVQGDASAGFLCRDSARPPISSRLLRTALKRCSTSTSPEAASRHESSPATGRTVSCIG
jgi:hypothetical protein